jgi:hypothetical protein
MRNRKLRMPVLSALYGIRWFEPRRRMYASRFSRSWTGILAPSTSSSRPAGARMRFHRAPRASRTGGCWPSNSAISCALVFCRFAASVLEGSSVALALVHEIDQHAPHLVDALVGDDVPGWKPGREHLDGLVQRGLRVAAGVHARPLGSLGLGGGVHEKLARGGRAALELALPWSVGSARAPGEQQERRDALAFQEGAVIQACVGDVVTRGAGGLLVPAGRRGPRGRRYGARRSRSPRRRRPAVWWNRGRCR